MKKIEVLAEQLRSVFGSQIQALTLAHDELTLTVHPQDIIPVCERLRDQDPFLFEMLIDLCGVDYLHYGCSEWETLRATSRGFERAVRPIQEMIPHSKQTTPRLAVVYHLLSITHNQRLRVKAFVPDEAPLINSVTKIWNSANWYEREAFDLYGILFAGHPDLRRLLTDYGFIGHPFRKDFPLVGNVEVRYDAKLGRVIYEPVDIVPRTLTPKVIRKDHSHPVQEGSDHGRN